MSCSPQFDAIYTKTGRPSVPPEQLLRALLLQALYTVRSERMLVEQLEYNLLFRLFVGLGMDDTVWTPTTFTKNRERSLAGDIARQFFAAVLPQARGRRLLSDEHFTVDGTRLEASAGKSFTRKDGTSSGPSDDDFANPTVNFTANAGRMTRTSRRQIPTAAWRRRPARPVRRRRTSAPRHRRPVTALRRRPQRFPQGRSLPRRCASR